MKNPTVFAAILALSAPSLAIAQQTTDPTGASKDPSVQMTDQALAHLLATGVANTDRPDQPAPKDPTLPAANKQAGGIIAGENATVSTTNRNRVLLEDNAQQNVSTVNLVNNSGAMTDNASNIWHSDFKDTSIDLVPMTFNSNMVGEQSNVVSQTNGNAASVGGYNEYEAGESRTFSSSNKDSAHASVTAGNDTTSLMEGFLFDSEENIGRGIAASAGADVFVDAGEVTIGGEVTAEGNLAWGLLSAESTVEVGLTVELPTIDIDFEGTACAAFEGASCAAGHDSDSTESSSETLVSVPVETISNAHASIIAKDHADVITFESNLVKLEDNAQQNVDAVNVVNAAGGMVGNGLNIAHTNGMSMIVGSTVTFSQSNVLIQSQ